MWKYHWHPVWHGLCSFSPANIFIWNFALIQKRLGNSTMEIYKPYMHNQYLIFKNTFSLLSLPLSHCLKFFTRAFLDQGSCRCCLQGIQRRQLSCEQGSLITQLVKNLSAMQEPQFNSWVRKICWRRDRLPFRCSWACPVAQLVKNLPAMLETWARSLG